MHHGNQKLFEKRADLSAIYPGNELWMVTAGKVKKIQVDSSLYLHPVAGRNTYRFNFFCKRSPDVVNKGSSIWTPGAAFAGDYGLGKKSNGGNCLFYNEEDANAYAESINRHRCTYCGRDL